MTATKPCPTCGGEILTVAQKCKHCKNWVKETNPSDASGTTPVPAVLGSTRKPPRFAVIVMALLAICGGAVFALTQRQQSLEAPSSQSPTALRPSGVGGKTSAEVQPIQSLPRTSPERGSALRLSIMDALRPRVSEILGAPVTFMVDILEVEGHSAFYVGHPVHVDGTEFSDDEVSRAFEGEVYDGVRPTIAWLVRTPEGWKLKELAINQSDVGGFLHWCLDREMRSLMDSYWRCN